MPDIHAEKFDNATQIKLDILREYLKEWLPVFLRKKEKFWKEIFIYDFFAGEGYDSEGNEGSPLIILNELTNYKEDISNENIKLEINFNDIDSKKIKKLEKEVLRKNYNLDVNYHNEDFTQLFEKLYPSMMLNKKNLLPRFMFIDQYGVKFVTKEIFNKLSNLDRTDFLFFISSNFVKRFAELEEFKKYIKITKQEFIESKPFHCHRVVFNYFKNMIPENKELYLAPFSLEKENGNVYGLIFGSHHILGIEKFINLAWKLDGITGEANFNIDGAILEGNNYDLFNPDVRPKKIQLFESELKEKIKNNEITNLKEVYRYTFNYGCLVKHANDILKELKTLKVIKKDLKLHYSNVHKLDDNILLK